MGAYRRHDKDSPFVEIADSVSSLMVKKADCWRI